jgi:hypothetical protein
VSPAPSNNPRVAIGLLIGVVLLGALLLAGTVWLLKPWQWTSPTAALPGAPAPDLSPAVTATQGEPLPAVTPPTTVSATAAVATAKTAQSTTSPSPLPPRLPDLSTAVFSHDDLGQGFESVALDRMGVPKAGTIDPDSGLPVGGSFVLQHQTSEEMLLGLVLFVTDPTTGADFDTALGSANFENSEFAKNYLQGLNLGIVPHFP